MENMKRWEGAVEIPLELLVEDQANPNVMDDRMLAELVEMIRCTGFDEPVQCAPGAVLPDGRQSFVLVGGHHRVKAARILGMTCVPAVVKDRMEEGERRMEMVRRNVVRGELDRVKFGELVASLEGRDALSLRAMAEKMGFGAEKALRERMERKKGVTADALDKLLADSHREIVLVNNLSWVLNEIMSKYGETAPEGWLFFAYKERFTLLVQSSPSLARAIDVLCMKMREDKASLQDFINEAIREKFARAGVDVEEAFTCRKAPRGGAPIPEGTRLLSAHEGVTES